MIKAHELAAWYQGVTRISEDREEENASMWQDYFLLILFTGLRRSEAGKLTTANLDFKAKTFTIYDTKKHEEHTLPMSDFLYQLLERRVAASKTSEFLFPANSKSGYVVEPRKAIDKIIKFSGIQFTTHDLRRTFITIAESLDISTYTLKRLLNHKMNNDVTAGYIVANVERLRKPMQLITDYILSAFSETKETLCIINS